MGDGLRSIRVVSTDESLIASTRSVAEGLGGWEVVPATSIEELIQLAPAVGDLVLLDGWLRGGNVYEMCRELTGKIRCRTLIVTEHDNRLADPIARFCGASGIVTRPLTLSKIRAMTERITQTPPSLPQDARGSGGDNVLPEKLLVDLAGQPDHSLVAVLTDAETSLFNYPFLNFKLDEEFKRARRFDQPLSCVMLGFEGQASEEVLRELAGIFLLAARDTDVLGRFDENSFLFLLPNTGPDGAATMARRVSEVAEERGLVDLVGDALNLSVGISSCPNAEIQRREDLFGRAREAFFSARAEGGGVITAV